MCMTVDLTIFYSLNSCTRIIFTLCYCVFLLFFTFIYSCVLSSVFYTINEKNVIIGAWRVCKVQSSNSILVSWTAV